MITMLCTKTKMYFLKWTHIIIWVICGEWRTGMRGCVKIRNRFPLGTDYTEIHGLFYFCLRIFRVIRA